MDNRAARLTLMLLTAATAAGCASTPDGGTASNPFIIEAPPEESAATPAVEPAVSEPRAAAPAPRVRPDYPERYVVRRGDTLWDIAGRFLEDPWRWPELWQKNPAIENPHLIYPGDVLHLVYIEGVPTMQVRRAERDAYPVVKLSPQVRVEELDRAIPTIPVDAIKQFLSRPRVTTPEELEAAPYIVSTPDGHLIAGAGNDLYVRGIEEPDVTEYVVVRGGDLYRDPATDEVLGMETVYVGDAQLLDTGEEREAAVPIATLRLLSTQREALVGDRLLPAGERELITSFMPKAPLEPVDGEIIALVDGVAQVGQYQVVVINLGEREALEVGDVLALYQSGDTVRDPVTNEPVQLPRIKTGTVMVFRTFERVSYALIMQALRPISVGNSVTNP